MRLLIALVTGRQDNPKMDRFMTRLDRIAAERNRPIRGRRAAA